MRILVDTAYVGRDEAEQWLRAFESVLVAAVRRPELDTRALATETGLAPFSPTADWAMVDHSWIHLPTATARLRSALPGIGLRLSVETHDGDSTLTGIVSDTATGRDLIRPADVDVTEAFQDCKVAMRPHRFISETNRAPEPTG